MHNIVVHVDLTRLNAHVCRPYDNFRKPWRRTFIFTHPVCLQGIWV